MKLEVKVSHILNVFTGEGGIGKGQVTSNTDAHVDECAQVNGRRDNPVHGLERRFRQRVVHFKDLSVMKEDLTEG